MNTGETIALIKAFGKGGGSSLPPVTSSDNGKVLAVKDGAWAADSNLFVVNMPTYNTADKTYGEIVAAYESGKIVVLKYAGGYYYLSSVISTEVTFARISNGASQIGAVGINSDNSVHYSTLRLLPSSSSADNGSELIVKNGNWAKQQKKFVVTLTPTSPDYSGTMDKTVAEINAAYEAGQEIWFKLEASGMGYLMEMAGIGNGDPESTYPSFNVKFLANNTLLYVNSGFTNDGTKQTYSTYIYSLTPAS